MENSFCNGDKYSSSNRSGGVNIIIVRMYVTVTNEAPTPRQQKMTATSLLHQVYHSSSLSLLFKWGGTRQLKWNISCSYSCSMSCTHTYFHFSLRLWIEFLSLFNLRTLNLALSHHISSVMLCRLVFIATVENLHSIQFFSELFPLSAQPNPYTSKFHFLKA